MKIGDLDIEVKRSKRRKTITVNIERDGSVNAVAFLLEIIVLVLLCIVLTFLCISVVHAVTARLRIEQLFKYYWTVVAGLALISLVLAWYGL